MKKSFKNIIFIFMILIIICCTITGVIAYNVAATQVAYTPSDNTWEVTNVNDALNYLKNNSGRVKSFDFNKTAANYEIDLGFKAKYISCTYYADSNRYVNVIYNYDYDQNKVYNVASDNGSGGTANNWVRYDVSEFFDIGNSKLKVINSAFSGEHIYCMAATQ